MKVTSENGATPTTNDHNRDDGGDARDHRHGRYHDHHDDVRLLLRDGHHGGDGALQRALPYHPRNQHLGQAKRQQAARPSRL